MGIKIYNHKGEFGIYDEGSGEVFHIEDMEEHRITKEAESAQQKKPSDAGDDLFKMTRKESEDEAMLKLYEEIMTELEQQAEGEAVRQFERKVGKILDEEVKQVVRDRSEEEVKQVVADRSEEGAKRATGGIPEEAKPVAEDRFKKEALQVTEDKFEQEIEQTVKESLEEGAKLEEEAERQVREDHGREVIQEQSDEQLEKEMEDKLNQQEKRLDGQFEQKFKERLEEDLKEEAKLQQLDAQRGKKPSDESEVNLKTPHEITDKPGPKVSDKPGKKASKDRDDKHIKDHAKDDRSHDTPRRTGRISRRRGAGHQALPVSGKRVDNIKFEMSDKGCFINGKLFDPKNPPEGLAIAVDQKTAKS
ncbi:MAG TPA: hypothetical protein GXZ32_05650 [Clostridiales bacterium]|nr:hypothetical protein [Clostridiales bacterium]